jgi:subtilisin family serine protease
VALALLAVPRSSAGPPAQAYLDPALRSAAPVAAVIVTAGDAAAAARAVTAAGGAVTADLWLIDAVAARVPSASLAALTAAPGVVAVVANRGVASSDWDGWVTDLPLPSVWDGRPDVQPTADPTAWQVVNPVAIDIGADKLHSGALNGGKPVRGDGVTVAVVDSGVYFDADVRAELGAVVSEQFVGQADFVDSQCQVLPRSQGRAITVGRQRSDHCWLSHADTADGYGHGTAVASIIWNNFTDANTGVSLGVAPGADILSVRVLDDSGVGTYETVIKGIQFVVQQRGRYNVGVLNLSLSAPADVPYFVDPLNRAVEAAWLQGITVVAAAGNDGPRPGSVTVPGNDPYVITVGAVDSNRTPGYWADDRIPQWSASGPTGDGFVKPDLLAPGANIITFMHKDPSDPARSQRIVQMHPDNAATSSLFRMSGTSMSAAVASGVAALMLDANPRLDPDQVKYRLMTAARPAAMGAPSALVYPVFRQGMGRIWAPDAVLGAFDRKRAANEEMNLRADLRAGFGTQEELAKHYQGPVRSAPSADGSATLYYVGLQGGGALGLGAWSGAQGWLDSQVLGSRRTIWVVGGAPLADGAIKWAGGLPLPGDTVEPSRRMIWVVNRMAWDGAATWASGMLPAEFGAAEPDRRMIWVVGRLVWSGGLSWQDAAIDPDRRMIWVVAINPATETLTTTSWVSQP